MVKRWLILVGALALAGCDEPKAASDDSAEKDDAKSKKADDEGDEKSDDERERTEAAKADAPADKAEEKADGDEAAVDDGTPPTAAEWNAQTKEVTVRGSSALNCETKMVRTWLRISCRGTSDTGGEATSVEVTKGGGDGKTFTFASAGVTSLVLPFVEGVDVEAAFGWSDKKMKLHVFWPRGAPEPPAKGSFSPL